MHTRRALLMLIVPAALTACGAGDISSEPEQPPPVEETVFAETVGTIDKARSVEETLMQQKADTDRKLQESER